MNKKEAKINWIKIKNLFSLNLARKLIINKINNKLLYQTETHKAKKI